MLEITKRAIREMVRKQAVRAHVEGMRRYGTQREINPRHEMTYRLCHQDFCGLSHADAAEVSGTSRQTVERLLIEVEGKAPQLFPVLSPRVAKMYEMFMEGHTCKEIAGVLGVSARAVQKAIRRLINKGQLYFRSGSIRRLSYQPWQDEYIRERF